MPRIETVLRANLCTGCGLCVAMAPDANLSLSYDGDGYLRPIGLETLSDEVANNLIKICPGINGLHIGNCHENMNKDELWGAYDLIGVGYSMDETTRYRGSSGGVLTEIGRFLLDSGQVNAVVASRSFPDDPLRVEAILVTSAEDLIEMAGSKYAPSAPLSQLSLMRDFDGKIAFIGKPCDVTGLRLACSQDHELRDKIAVYLSFFCAGVPSEHANEQIVQFLGTSRDELVEFWHRGRGWPGKTTAVSRSGQRGEMTYHDAWGSILSKQLQFRCKICADGIGESADIVAGDAWECDNDGYPTFDEADGQSLVLSRTVAGTNVLRSLVINNRLKLTSIDLRTIDRMQPGQLRRRRTLSSRLFALKLLRKLVPEYPKKEISNFSKGLPVAERLKSIFGTLRRLLKMKKSHL